MEIWDSGIGDWILDFRRRVGDNTGLDLAICDGGYAICDGRGTVGAFVKTRENGEMLGRFAENRRRVCENASE